MSDLRLALRALRSTPVVSSVAMLSLALGIGANTAIFSLVDALLLRPLPVRTPDRLVTISSDFALRNGLRAGLGMSYAMWRRLESHGADLAGAFAWSADRVNLAERGEVEPADALVVTGGFFDTLGVGAHLGRTFTPAADVRGGGPDGPVVVIGYDLWQRRFGGAPDVLGKTLPVDGLPCTIIGVMPPGFFGIEVGRPFDVLIPLGVEPLIKGTRVSLHDPRSLMLTVMARLKDGQSIEAASDALRVAQKDMLDGLFPAGNLPKWLAEPFRLVPAATGTSDRSGLRTRYTRPLLTILAVAALVLLIACANIANLALARGNARRHELSVRLALGATRGRLARQLFVESLVLAIGGTLLGLLVARWSAAVLIAQLSAADTTVALDLSVDWRVLMFAAALAAGTAIVFGTQPALRVLRLSPMDVLRAHARGVTQRSNLSSAAVAIQVALSLVLVVAAALLIRSFERLAAMPLGFDSDRILVVSVETARSMPAGTEPPARIDYYHRLAALTAAVPGVERAAASIATPLDPGTRSPLNAQPDTLLTHRVAPGWFATYGTRLRAGRDFDNRDTAGGQRVAVVNEAYVRAFLPGREPLGAAIDKGPCSRRDGGCTVVVGVVGDAVYGWTRAGMRPTVYLPLAQSATQGLGATSVRISVRSASIAPRLLAPAVAAALTAEDSNLSFSMHPLTDDVRADTRQDRVVASLAGFFGVLAVALAALGIYGVTAYTVSRRRAELGIRLALGATPAGLRRLVLERVLLLIGIGLAAGAAVSVWATVFLGALLYEVTPRDPMTLAGAAAFLAAIGILAAWLPVVRGTRIDPAEVLRES